MAKHLTCSYQRPIPTIAQQTFTAVKAKIERVKRPIILDSGCGIGYSSQLLAEQHPEHWVLGIDQSVHRLAKAEQQKQPDNLLLIRANLIDFWRLAVAAKWILDKHYLLYPNPWPKKQHLKRRWHGHPVWPDLVALGGQLELRTNWLIYGLEMHRALELSGIEADSVESFSPETYLTPFEQKYHLSGQELYRLTADLS